MLSNPKISLRSALSLQNRRPLIVAHRGEWSKAPENTIAAFEAALHAGADMVELDAQLSRDGTPVVFHDTDVKRMTGQDGSVSDLTFAALRELPLRFGGGGTEMALSNEYIPALADVLDALRDRLFINIDVKFPEEIDPIASVVESVGMTDQVIVKIPVDPQGDHRGLVKAPWFGKVAFMPIIDARAGHFADDVERMAQTFRPMMIEIMFADLEEVARARPVTQRHDIRIWTNTLDIVHSMDFCDSRALKDPQSVWGTLVEAGIGAFQTDICSVLRDYVRNMNW